MQTPAPHGLTRRHFLRASAASVGTVALAAGVEPGLARSADSKTGMQIAEMFPPSQGRLARLMKQCGVNYVDGEFRRDPGESSTENPWDYPALERLKKAYEAQGFELVVIESRPPTDKIKLGLPGRDAQIEQICKLIQNMGKLHIPVWCYEWMPVINWLRTSTDIRSRGGALVTGFDYDKIKDQPLTQYGTLSDEQSWTNLRYFLERVLPVAEKAHVKLAMHPDDPPLSPIRGLARIMRSPENFQRLLDLVPSEANGITLCQGNFTLMTDDLPSVIRHFGKQQKIFFVHFRDVRGTPRKYQETFHDDGKTDMAACMRAYRDTGFSGVCRSDHVPTMDGESNEKPGYSTIGRLFAVGYIRGLIQSVYSET
jgi:mannonate dehydratase